MHPAQGGRQPAPSIELLDGNALREVGGDGSAIAMPYYTSATPPFPLPHALPPLLLGEGGRVCAASAAAVAIPRAPTGFWVLPPPPLQVLSWLEVPDLLGGASLVCKHWRSAASCKEVWRRRVHSSFLTLFTTDGQLIQRAAAGTQQADGTQDSTHKSPQKSEAQEVAVGKALTPALFFHTVYRCQGLEQGGALKQPLLAMRAHSLPARCPLSPTLLPYPPPPLAPSHPCTSRHNMLHNAAFLERNNSSKGPDGGRQHSWVRTSPLFLWGVPAGI